MFGWLSRRKNTENSTPVQREPMPETITRSVASDALARELLATIQEQGKDQPVPAELSYDIPESKMTVSPYELTFSLMDLAGEYGLRFTSLAMGVVNCTKI